MIRNDGLKRNTSMALPIFWYTLLPACALLTTDSNSLSGEFPLFHAQSSDEHDARKVTYWLYIYVMLAWFNSTIKMGHPHTPSLQ